MNRLERLTSILIQLQSRRVNKATEIAEKYKISVRTVYRDIRALEEAGVPIGVDQNKGYYIVPGYHLPPVMFTTSEAAALLTGEKLINSLSDLSIKDQFSSALTKIRAVLKEKEKEKLEGLESSITVQPYINFKGKATTAWLSSIQEAIIDSVQIKIQYVSGYIERETVRTVSPIGLYFYSEAWHLIAFCSLRNDYRDFRVDRIKRLEHTLQHFDKRTFSSLQDYLRNIMMKDEELKKAIVRFKTSMVKYVEKQKHYYGLIEEVRDGEWTEMTFLTPCYSYLAKWLLPFTSCVEILEPNELVDLILNYAQEAFLHFNKQLVPLKT